MRDVDQPLRIDGDIVRRLPSVIHRQLAPVVEALILVFAFTDNRIRVIGFACHPEENRASGDNGSSGEEFASVHVGEGFVVSGGKREAQFEVYGWQTDIANVLSEARNAGAM
jgi:hypothetical protein